MPIVTTNLVFPKVTNLFMLLTICTMAQVGCVVYTHTSKTFDCMAVDVNLADEKLVYLSKRLFTITEETELTLYEKNE